MSNIKKFAEFVNESLNEGSRKKVTKSMWQKMSVDEKAIKGKDAGNYIKMAPKGRKLHILGTKDGSDQKDYISLGKGKWQEKRTGEKLNWIELSAITSALGDTKVFYEGKLTEAKFNKKKLMKAMKKDDGVILVGGKEYIVYKYDNGNDDNDEMWQDDAIFALDQDGEEHEIKYSDIERYSESVVTESFADFNKSSGFKMDSKAKSTLKKLNVNPTKLKDAFDDYSKIMKYLDSNGKKIGTVSIPNPGSKSNPEFMYTVYDTDKYGKVLTGDGDSVFIEMVKESINENK